MDATVRPVSKPGDHQMLLYNGHKVVHVLKFQSLGITSG